MISAVFSPAQLGTRDARDRLLQMLGGDEPGAFKLPWRAT